MDDIIQTRVREVADEYGVSVVNARQRGSRMINADHAGSDYDALFLFKQEPVEYLYVGGPSIETINAHGPEYDIDITGWDIRKFTNLLLDSNPDAVSYCRSEKEYISNTDSFSRVAENAIENVNMMSLYHHYISMASNQYNKYVESGGAPATRQFHIARAVACATYIREENELPPLDVEELISSPALPVELADTLETMLMHRRDGNGEMEIDNLVGSEYLRERDATIEATPERTGRPDVEVLNEFIKREF